VTESWLQRLLRPLLRWMADVRPQEARAAVLFFSYFFMITLPAYIIKPLKDSFLIEEVRPGWWPYADLVTALLIGFVVAFNARLLKRLPRRNYISTSIVFFMTNLFIFWFIFDFNARSVYQTPVAASGGFWWMGAVWYQIQQLGAVPVILFCFWADVFIAMSVTQFWIAVNDVFYPYQAKRMVGFFVSGGLLGGISGALATSILVRLLGQEALLLVCIGLLFVTLTVVNLVYAEQKRLREGGVGREEAAADIKVGILESFRVVRKNRYLRILGGILASAVVVGTLVNFQFKIVLLAAFEDGDARAAFIAAFFFAVLVISSIFHIVTTDRVLRNFGIRLGLTVAPLVLLLGSLAPLALPAIGLVVWACIMRGSDKVFDNTLNQSVRELLYIPVPSDIKYRAKIFIDMFVSKFATGFGAVLFLVLFHVFRFNETVGFDTQLAFPNVGERLGQMIGPIRILSGAALALIAIWLFLIRRIYKEYVGAVGKDIRRIWEDPHKVLRENLDEDVTKLFLDTIQSRNVSETLYAMNVFDLVRKEKLTPELKEILTCKSGEIKARSMDSLLEAGCESFIPEFGEIMADEGFETQIKEILELDSFKKIMGKHLESVTQGAEGTVVERMEAAKLAGNMEMTPEVLSSLKSLLQDESPEVLDYALSSAAVHRREELLPHIVPHLANLQTRQAAQLTLAAYDDSVVEFLCEKLRNGEEDFRVREAIPEVLARFGTQTAADNLLAELSRGGGDLEHELVDSLYRIKSSRPAVVFDERRVLASVLGMIRKAYAVYLEGPLPSGGQAGAVFSQDVKSTLDRRIKGIFDLLSLIYPSEEIVKACQNIFQGTRASVDYSLELLDNILNREFKALLFPLVEDLPLEEKVRRLRKLKKDLDRMSL
jgi:AAA family ATP:ADP antiporter